MEENSTEPETEILCICLNSYFTKYPNQADQVVVVMKGSMNPDTIVPEGTEAGVRRSVEHCLKVLDGKKAIDVFECSSFDPEVSIEGDDEELKSVER